MVLKESSRGVGGYRAGIFIEIMYKGGGCFRLVFNRVELVYGGGVYVGRIVLFGVFLFDCLFRVFWRVRGWE